MRTCLALFGTLALFVLSLLLVCLEAESLLGCPDAAYRWLDTWLLLVMALGSLAITLALPWIVELGAESDERG